MDLAAPSDHIVKRKESEKIDKYLDLARGLKKIWNMKVTEIPITLTYVKFFCQRLKVYQMIYDRRFMLNSKIPFIVFWSGLGLKMCLNTSQVVHNKTIIQKSVTLDRGCLMSNRTYNVVFVPNYSVPPYSLTPIYQEDSLSFSLNWL